MNLDFKINLLGEHPEYIPALSELWFNELGKQWIPNASVERANQTFQSHLNTDQLPMTFVAVHEGKPIAMASLRDNDGIREDLTPWLGTLIVHPDYRNQGVGELLINITKYCAKSFGFEKIYLLALDKTIPDWYEGLGWKMIGKDKLYHHPVTVMEIDL